MSAVKIADLFRKRRPCEVIMNAAGDTCGEPSVAVIGKMPVCAAHEESYRSAIGLLNSVFGRQS